MRPRFQWLAVPIAAAALLAAGCTGDEEPATVDTTPASTESTTEPPAEAPSTSTSEPSAETPASGADVMDLAALTGRLDEATFSATYALDAGATDEALTGTWKWTQDGATDRVRFDIESDGETVVVITTAEGTTFCSEGACFSVEAGDSMFPDLGGMLTDEVSSMQDEAADGSISMAASQTIAGVEAECYAFDDAAEGASGTICYSPEGVPLLIDASSAEGDFRLTADSYTTTVADEDFEPPFAVTSFPGMGTGN